MYDRLILFLEANRILKDNQFGFRKNYSPQLALIKFINHILQQHDRGNFTVCVFLDLRKAFDTINHDILIKKLEHYGIRNQTLNWFVSYLSGRQQYTEINGVKSNKQVLKTGVPQGSILGPLLFLIYINDFVDSSDILKSILFADDTNVFHSDSDLLTVQNTMNLELTSVSTWLLSNKLSLNVSKTKFMLFAGNKKINHDITIRIENKAK